MLNKKSILMAATCLCANIPTAAWAQAENQSETVENDNIIVVTANLRAQDLRDVPIAISAFDGESLQQSGVTEILDLVNVAPSIGFLTAQSPSTTTAIQIRGVGTIGNNPGFESAVGVFIDGVYQSRSSIALGEMFDVEQVEILRGPQGTLFGRNTSVGALTVRTNSPELSEFSGSVSASYGNFDMINLQAMVNLPASETLGFRFSGSYRERDNVKQSSTGAGTGGFDRFVVRGQALWEPSENVSVRLIGDYQENNASCCSFVVLSETLFAPLFPLAGVQPLANVGDRALDNNLTNTNGNIDNSNQWGITGELNWDLGGTTLTYVGSYREFESRATGDLDFGPQDFFGYTQRGQQQDIKTTTHELRFQGTAFNDRLDWLIGGYYSDERIRNPQSISLGVDYLANLNLNIFGALSDPAAGGNPLALGPNPGLFFTNGVDPAGAFSDVLFSQDAESLSIFTHNILEVTDGLYLTLGARYVDESKNGGQSQTGLGAQNNACLSTLGNLNANPLFFNGTPLDPSDDGPLAPLAGLGVGLICFSAATPLDLAPGLPTSFNVDFNDDEFVYTGNLRYEISPDVSVYASYSHGYKSGGISLEISASVGGASPTFGSETVDNAEFGLKTSLFGGAVDANLALYYMDIQNFQLLQFNGINFTVFNVPKARSRGFEFDTVARISENITLNGSLAYNDASFPTDCAPSGVNPAVLSVCGLPFVNAPEWVSIIGGNFRHEFGASGLELKVAPSLRYQSGTLTSVGNRLNPNDDAFIFDMRIGLGDIDEKWAVELWGQNIFDERVFQQSADIPLRGLSPASARGVFDRDPATYGLTLRGRF